MSAQGKTAKNQIMHRVLAVHDKTRQQSPITTETKNKEGGGPFTEGFKLPGENENGGKLGETKTREVSLEDSVKVNSRFDP